MKIKDKNELKGMTELTVDIPEEDLKKYLNRANMIISNSFVQTFNIPLNEETKKILSEEIKRQALLQMNSRVREYLKDEYLDNSDGFSFVSSFVEPTDSEEDELLAVVYTKPQIEFKYKNLIEPKPFEGLYEDEEEILVDTELKKLQKANARLNPVDRAFQDGDAVSLKESNGEQEETRMYYVEQLDELPTLKSNLIGKNVGDSFTYEPVDEDTYTIEQIYEIELDDIDDEFASEVSEFDTLEELKNSIVENEEKKLKDEHIKEERNNALLQFINEIKVSNVEDELIDYIENPEGFNESDVGAFMEGFLVGSEEIDYKGIEYFNQVLKYVMNQILNEENIDSDSVIKDIMDNWDSGDYDERYRAPLNRVRQEATNMTEEQLKELIETIVKANQVQDVIYKYSLDSEN